MSTAPEADVGRAAVDGRWPGLAPVALLAAAVVIVEVAVGNRYGFHRDELQVLADARQPAWGYVAYPPLLPAVARLAWTLCGLRPVCLRLFSALAQAGVLLATGWMARLLGGGWAVSLAAALATAPLALVAGHWLTYVSFDLLCWVLVEAALLARLATGNPRWWLLAGVAAGLGLLTKYTIGFLLLSILIGMFATDLRSEFRNGWLWAGGLVAGLIVLPHLVWEMRHGFVTLEFLRSIHERDVRLGRTQGFWLDQLRLTLAGLPLWVTGLLWSARGLAGRRFRLLAWMYAVLAGLLTLLQARGYYLAPVYPVLYAAGAVGGERWLRQYPRWRKAVGGGLWVALAADTVLAAALLLPVASPDTPWGRRILQTNPELAEEIGWPELVETLARIRDRLPPAERKGLCVLAGNYGEAGAVVLYGPRYGLLPVVSGVNSFWQRGYGAPPPEHVLVVGVDRDFLQEQFRDCRPVGRWHVPGGVSNEEARWHTEIFLCGQPQAGWPAFWKKFRWFG